MDKALVRSVIPYVLGLTIAIVLYAYTGTFEYTPRPGTLGPDVWPRFAILLMGASCLFELTRRLIVGNKDAAGFMEAFDREPQQEGSQQPIYLHLVAGGI